MGTDIHAAIEFRNGHGWEAVKVRNKYFGKWDDEPEMTARLPIGRDYDLFAILAGVRNGRGFAGCPLGDGFTPISPPRGLPEDISQDAREQVCTGDHSDTWLGLADLLAYDWTRVSTHYGVLSAIEFEEWDRRKQWQPAPTSFSGDVFGALIRKVAPDEMRAYIKSVVGNTNGAAYGAAKGSLARNLYARVEWVEGYAESAKQLWTDILPTMLKLGQEYGTENVRLVMNFDS